MLPTKETIAAVTPNTIVKIFTLSTPENKGVMLTATNINPRFDRKSANCFNWLSFNFGILSLSGGREIRTPDILADIAALQATALGHYAIPPN